MDGLKNTTEILAKAKLYPKLRLGEKQPGGGVISLGAKTVELVDDKIIKKIDPKDTQEKYYMRYNVKYQGKMHRYETKLNDENGEPSYFIQRMGTFNPGDTITLELKKAGVKNYVEITSDKDDLEDGHEIPTDTDELDEADVDTSATYILKKECKNIGKEAGDYYNGEYGKDAASLRKLLANGTIEILKEEEPPE